MDIGHHIQKAREQRREALAIEDAKQRFRDEFDLIDVIAVIIFFADPSRSEVAMKAPYRITPSGIQVIRIPSATEPLLTHCG